MERQRMQPWSQTEEFSLQEARFDPRGWPLLGGDERMIGELEELIVDVAAGKVRYAAIRMALWDEWLETRPFRLLPIGLLRLDITEERVWLDGFAREDIIGFPAYDGEEVHPDLEVSIRHGLLGDNLEVGEGFYEGPLYRNEDLGLRRQHRIDSRM